MNNETPRPRVVLRVADLEASLRFYTLIGFKTERCDAGAGMAVVRAEGSSPLLLSVPGAEAGSWCDAQAVEAKPGRMLYHAGRDLPGLYVRLVAEGLDAATYREEPWGDRTLSVSDPDGYVIGLWEAAPLADEPLLSLYLEAPERLRKALAGLDEADLDLARAPGKWSIRQIVHHMVDSDTGMLRRIKAALAEPGRVFHDNPYDQDLWADALCYSRRPIAAEVDLFEAGRRHLGAVIRCIPDAWERSVRSSRQGEVSVRQMVRMLMSHAMGHIDQIEETRRVHRR